jgi:hypothetical protein
MSRGEVPGVKKDGKTGYFANWTLRITNREA